MPSSSKLPVNNIANDDSDDDITPSYDYDSNNNVTSSSKSPQTAKPIERKYWLRPLLFLMAVVALAIGASRLPNGFQLRGNHGNGGKIGNHTTSRQQGTDAPTAPPTTLSGMQKIKTSPSSTN